MSQNLCKFGLLLQKVYRAIALVFLHLKGNGIISFKEFVMATDMTTAGTPEEKLKVGLHCLFEQFVIVVLSSHKLVSPYFGTLK